MTESVTYTLPSELKTVRMQCLNCNFVIEVPAGKSDQLVDGKGACKNCNADLVDEKEKNAITLVGRSLETLSKPSKRFRLAFVTTDLEK